jgi:hypothetical protein
MVDRDRRASRKSNISEMKMKTFKQHTGSRKIYSCHLGPDGEHHPASKPIWSIVEHTRGGDSTNALADLETAVDGMSARLIAHGLTGVVKISVTVSPQERTTWSDSFEVEIVPVPHLAEQSIAFQQHRNDTLIGIQHASETAPRV